MPFNLSDDGEALDGVLSVFGNDRAALADLLLAVGKVFVFFFGLRMALRRAKNAVGSE